MIAIVLAIFGACLSVIGAIVQYKEKEDAKKKAEIARAETASFNDKLISSQEALIAAQQSFKEQSDKANNEIVRLNNELLKQTSGLLDESEKARKIQEETIKYVLGDDGPDLEFSNTRKNFYKFIYKNNGKYPVYDAVSVRENWSQILNCITIEESTVFISPECYKKNSEQTPSFLVGPGSGRNLPEDSVKEGELKLLRFQCITRAKVTLFYCVLGNKNGNVNSIIRRYEGSYDNLKLISEKSYGLEVHNENFWTDNFYLKKKITIAEK